MSDGSPAGTLTPDVRGSDLARASSLLFLVEFVNMVLGFASTVYFARELGATLLGAFFLFEATLHTMTTVVDFGLSGAVEKRVSAGDDPGRMFGAGLVLKLPLIAVVSAVLLAFREPIGGYIGLDLVPELVAVVVVFELATLCLRVLQGELRVGRTAILHLLRSLTYVGLSVGLLAAGYGVRGLVYALLVSYLVLFVGAAARLSTPVRRPGWRHLRSLYDYAKFNGIWGIGGHVYNWMDVIVIGFVLSQAAVGAYELAWRLTTMIVIFSTVFATALFPQLSALEARGARERLTGLLSESMTATLLLVIPSVVGAALLAEQILGVVFGVEYIVAAGAFVVLSAEKLAYALNLVFDRGIQAMDRPVYGAAATIVSLSVNIGLNVLLVPQFGLVGAAAATLLAVVADTAMLGYFLDRLIPLRFPVADVTWCVVSGLVMGAWLVVLLQFVDAGRLPGLLTAVVSGAVVYGAAVLVSPSLREKVLANVQAVV